jgi:hypothetical protein
MADELSERYGDLLTGSYEALRIDMHNLFQHLHLDTISVAA